MQEEPLALLLHRLLFRLLTFLEINMRDDTQLVLSFNFVRKDWSKLSNVLHSSMFKNVETLLPLCLGAVRSTKVQRFFLQSLRFCSCHNKYTKANLSFSRLYGTELRKNIFDCTYTTLISKTCSMFDIHRCWCNDSIIYLYYIIDFYYNKLL